MKTTKQPSWEELRKALHNYFNALVHYQYAVNETDEIKGRIDIDSVAHKAFFEQQEYLDKQFLSLFKSYADLSRQDLLKEIRGEVEKYKCGKHKKLLATLSVKGEGK